MSADMPDVEESPKRSLRRRSANTSVVLPPKKKRAVRKLSVEDIYLQKDFVPSSFVGTSLETIYESPKSRGTGNSIMGATKLRRHCKFVPFTPSKSKTSKRKDRAMILKRLRRAGRASFPTKVPRKSTLHRYEDEENSLLRGTIEMPCSSNTSDVEPNSASSSTQFSQSLDAFSSNFTARLSLSDKKVGSEGNTSTITTPSGTEIHLNPLFSFKTETNKATRKRRSSQLFGSNAFTGVFPDELKSDFASHRLPNTLTEEPEDSSPESDVSNKRFCPSTTSRVSGIYGNLFLDPLLGQGSPADQEGVVVSLTRPEVADPAEAINLTKYVAAPAQDQSLFVENIRSKRKKSRVSSNFASSLSSLGALSLNADNECGSDSTASLPSTQFSNLSIGGNFKTATNHNRRRSARLSMGAVRSSSTLGSMWLDQ